MGTSSCACPSNRGLAEVAPFAYKDVERVVAVVEGAGLCAHRAARATRRRRR
jgi:RNA-splicing ligase RtcB